MTHRYDRREALRLLGGALLGGEMSMARAVDATGARKGCVVGQPQAAQAGAAVLAAGGNAVDAAVAAALVAGVVAVYSCGIGGYGGHLIIAWPGRRRSVAIDFNSTAPAAARPDLFPRDATGAVPGQVNRYGWLAAGVPGTLAGLQLALDRHGTKPFREVVQPALRYARDGFPITTQVAASLRGARQQFLKDPGSARLFYPNGEALTAGSTFRNPDLAALLQTLAERNSVASFYDGDIAQRIAAAFQKHGGLVSAADLAAYRAREVEPLELSWHGYTIRTAPLTAGGLTVLQALHVLQALGWESRPSDDPRTAHARLEALRLAWSDRLRLLGDPEQAAVPVERLLSPAYARELAGRVETAVRERKPVAAQTDGGDAGGTIHLSAADAQGMLVALTLTHGENFGARVTVDGLGLVLGHGMSRFDPEPGRPNSVGPGKRPLHNMCPTVVLREGQPVLALGGTGGRRIPSAVFHVLTEYVGRDRTLEEAVAAPRLYTEGGLAVTAEVKAPDREVEYLAQCGYAVKRGPGAIIQAVAFDPKTRTCRTASR